MSYSRFGTDDSSVYVYADCDGYVACCGCILDKRWDYHSADEVVAHMEEHVAAGHVVPAHLLDPALYPDEDFVPYVSKFDA